MSKNEIALQLTLAMIEKGYTRFTDVDSNVDYGSQVAEMYNAIIHGIDARGNDAGTPATFG